MRLRTILTNIRVASGARAQSFTGSLYKGKRYRFLFQQKCAAMPEDSYILTVDRLSAEGVLFTNGISRSWESVFGVLHVIDRRRVVVDRRSSFRSIGPAYEGPNRRRLANRRRIRHYDEASDILNLNREIRNLTILNEELADMDGGPERMHLER